MNIANQPKQRNSRERSEALKPANNDDEDLAGLSMKGALENHAAWKIRLKDLLDGNSSEPIDINMAACDDCCAVGKWLNGTGKSQFGHLPEYDGLRMTHANFHLTAGEILKEHSNGNKPLADDLLRVHFNPLSNRVRLDLVRLFRKAKYGV